MCNSYLSFDLKLVMIAILNLLSKISTSLNVCFLIVLVIMLFPLTKSWPKQLYSLSLIVSLTWFTETIETNLCECLKPILP